MSKTTATKTTVKTTVAKAEPKATKVKKAAPMRDGYKALVAELKTIMTARRAKKAEIQKKVDALWAEYRDYTKSEYKTKRTAAIAKFEAQKKAAADARAARKAVKVEKTVKKAVKAEKLPK